MNILIPDSWLRDYLDSDINPDQLKEYLSLCGPSVEQVQKTHNDYVYNIEITTNRIDMASVYGIAREAKALLPRFGKTAILKPIELPIIENISNKLPLEVVDDDHLCNRLLAVVMEDVKIGPSPKYIRDRLEMSGVRSINNLIDITNYLMLELGHPSHVFDYDRIKTNKLILRKAKDGEKLVTLDDKLCQLTENDVVIDDGTGRIIDLPGIMGTSNSVVTDNTKRIVLFIESNNPLYIRKTSMRLALRTLAATINEKDPDPVMAKTVLLKGIKLYQEIASAKLAHNIIDIYPKPRKATDISVNIDFINKRLGIDLSKNEIIEILKSLNFNIKNYKDKVVVSPPSFRLSDVNIPEDIVEEVARIYGYHRLPSKLMNGNIPIRHKSNEDVVISKTKTMLKYWGNTEIYSYSFISSKLLNKSDLPVNACLCLKNPLTEEFQYMRTSLIPSILQIVKQNQHYNNHLSLFELAKIYIINNHSLPNECYQLVLTNQNSFYDLKGAVTGILQELGIEDYLESVTNIPDFFHPKQSVILLKNNDILATIGKIHPNTTTKFEIINPLFIAQINFENLIKYYNPIKKYNSIPIYPPVIEDITLKVKGAIKVGQIRSEISKINKIIYKVEFVSQYKNNITLQITYLDKEKNLSKEEVKLINHEIINYFS